MKNLLLPLSLILFFSATSPAQIIAAGNNHSLALCSNETIQAFGANAYGGLGNGTNTDSNVPVPVNSLTDVIAVAGGDGILLP